MKISKNKVLLLFILLQSALLFYLPKPVFAKKNVLLSKVDFKTTINSKGEAVCNVKWGGWDPTSPDGGYGGRQSESCLVRSKTEDLPAEAIYTFTNCHGIAKKIEIEHLDGYADDSFNVYVLENWSWRWWRKRRWIFIGSYTDVDNATEKWFNHEFDLNRIPLKGRKRCVTVKIEPTGENWGQVAIDKMELWGNGRVYRNRK